MSSVLSQLFMSVHDLFSWAITTEKIGSVTLQISCDVLGNAILVDVIKK